MLWMSPVPSFLISSAFDRYVPNFVERIINVIIIIIAVIIIIIIIIIINFIIIIIIHYS